jgi:hypothetical protein
VRPDGSQQPRDRRIGFFAESESNQRARRIGDIPNPRESIVPVLVADMVLGKRRRRGCGDRTGRTIDQKLQCERAALHGACPRPLVVVFLRPEPPVTHRAIDTDIRELWHRHVRGLALAAGNREDVARPRRRGERSGESLPATTTRAVIDTAHGECHPVNSKHLSVDGVIDPRRGGAEHGARLDPPAKVHRAAYAVDTPRELGPG